MFLFFAVCLQAVKNDRNDEGDDDDFSTIVTKQNFIEANLEEIKHARDPPPMSSVAYVTTYTNDQPPYFGYLQMLITLGYSLKLFNPNIDRVVIMREEYRDQPDLVRLVEKTWTHVLFRSPLIWPSEKYDHGDVYHAKWFKYHAWTLTRYKKIILLGCDTMLLQDITPIFKYPAPAASYLLSNYKILKDGPMFNSDFMMVEPSMEAFCSLLELALPYVNHETKDAATLGSDDSAPLHLYYKRDIFMFPILFVHENGGYKETVLGDPRNNQFHYVRALAVHFAGKGKPWRRYSIYTEIWAQFALVMFDKLDMPFRLKTVPRDIDDLWSQVFGDAIDKKSFWAPDMEEEEEDEEIGEDYYPEPHHSGARKGLEMICLLIFVSLIMLKKVVKSNNPFNLFLKTWEKKINEFVRLEDEDIPLLISDDNEYDDEDEDEEVNATIKHKRRKRRRRKKNTTSK